MATVYTKTGVEAQVEIIVLTHLVTSMRATLRGIRRIVARESNTVDTNWGQVYSLVKSQLSLLSTNKQQLIDLIATYKTCKYRLEWKVNEVVKGFNIDVNEGGSGDGEIRAFDLDGNYLTIWADAAVGDIVEISNSEHSNDGIYQTVTGVTVVAYQINGLIAGTDNTTAPGDTTMRLTRIAVNV